MNEIICALIAFTIAASPTQMFRHDAYEFPNIEQPSLLEIEEVENEDDIFEFDFSDVRTCIRGYVEYRNLDNDIYVDPTLAIAISRLETGNWKSKAFTDYNNFGGMMSSKGLMHFDSLESGLESFYNCLEWYTRKGMDDIRSMSAVYCPDDGTWEKLVTQIYKEETE